MKINKHNSDEQITKRIQTLITYRDIAWLKAPYSSKTDILLSKQDLVSYTIIKYGIWQPVKFQLISHSWTG